MIAIFKRLFHRDIQDRSSVRHALRQMKVRGTSVSPAVARLLLALETAKPVERVEAAQRLVTMDDRAIPEALVGILDTKGYVIDQAMWCLANIAVRGDRQWDATVECLTRTVRDRVMSEVTRGKAL